MIVIRNLVGRLFVQKQPHPAGDGAPLASNDAPSANGGAPVTSSGARLAGDGTPQRNALVLSEFLRTPLSAPQAGTTRGMTNAGICHGSSQITAILSCMYKHIGMYIACIVSQNPQLPASYHHHIVNNCMITVGSEIFTLYR